MDRLDAEVQALFEEVIRGPEDLLWYQRDIAIPFLRENPFSALFVDMGLGKTVSAYTVVSELVADFYEDKILIIAPMRVACDTWPTEKRIWRHLAWIEDCLIRVEDDDPRLIAAAKAQRVVARAAGLSPGSVERAAQNAKIAEKYRLLEELAMSPAKVHYINREAVEWLVYFFKGKWPYKTVIIDESSGFKDHNSLRFKALAKNRQHGLIHRIYVLTAQPAAEGLIGLWPQIYLLDMGKRLGKNITTFRKKWFSQNKYSHKWEIRPDAEEEILAKLADICLVMKSEDYLPRDEPQVIPRMVTLSPSQLDLIKKLERNLVITLPNGAEIEAKSAAMLSNMMLQMASGSLYETYLLEDTETDDLKKVRVVHDLHDHKIESLREIAEAAENEGKPLLVAYNFNSSLAKLKKAFPKATVMDDSGKVIKKWNAGKIPMLLIHPKSAGHGLNLQYGGSTLVFYDFTYSLEEYRQTIGRLNRQGQTKPVVVILLIAKGTRDEFVAGLLQKKKDAEDAFFRLLKRLIKEYKERKKSLAMADDEI